MKKDRLTSSFIDIRSKLHRVAMRLLQNDEDAKDALQDTFEKLWTKEKDEIESSEVARNKLVHILRNTCIDRLRSRRTIPLETAGEAANRGYEMPTEDMDQYERLILSGLSDLQRQIYKMVTKDCMEYDEIAVEMHMTAAAVRTNMCRARKLIRDNIKKIDR